MRHPGPMSFVAGVPLAIYRRVRLDESFELAYAAATDTDCIGITMRPALSAGDDVTVWTNGSEGTFENTSAGAFDQGATLYAADDGMVSDSGTVLVGVALQAADEAGCFIETLRL